MDLPPPTDLPVVEEPTVIDAANRAIVYCYVEWGIDERIGRQVVREAIAALRTAATTERIAFEFFAIEEDSLAFAEWIAAHGYGATGNGVVLWLEAGRLVTSVGHAASAGTQRIVNQTRAIWETARPKALVNEMAQLPPSIPVAGSRPTSDAAKPSP